MVVTVINSATTTSKIPKSPFGDNTFLFESIVVDDIVDVFSYMSHNFILNIPLSSNIKTAKRKSNLESLFFKKLQ